MERRLNREARLFFPALNQLGRGRTHWPLARLSEDQKPVNHRSPGYGVTVISERADYVSERSRPA